MSIRNTCVIAALVVCAFLVIGHYWGYTQPNWNGLTTGETVLVYGLSSPSPFNPEESNVVFLRSEKTGEVTEIESTMLEIVAPGGEDYTTYLRTWKGLDPVGQKGKVRIVNQLSSFLTWEITTKIRIILSST